MSDAGTVNSARDRSWLILDVIGLAQVNRADFGLTWNRIGTSMHNTITVHAVFTRQ